MWNVGESVEGGELALSVIGTLSCNPAYLGILDKAKKSLSFLVISSKKSILQPAKVWIWGKSSPFNFVAKWAKAELH